MADREQDHLRRWYWWHPTGGPLPSDWQEALMVVWCLLSGPVAMFAFFDVVAPTTVLVQAAGTVAMLLVGWTLGVAVWLVAVSAIATAWVHMRGVPP